MSFFGCSLPEIFADVNSEGPQALHVEAVFSFSCLAFDVTST